MGVLAGKCVSVFSLPFAALMEVGDKECEAGARDSMPLSVVVRPSPRIPAEYMRSWQRGVSVVNCENN